MKLTNNTKIATLATLTGILFLLPAAAMADNHRDWDRDKGSYDHRDRDVRDRDYRGYDRDDHPKFDRDDHWAWDRDRDAWRDRDGRAYRWQVEYRDGHKFFIKITL